MPHVRRRVVREARRPRSDRLPFGATVPRDIYAAVVPVHHMLAVERVDPDRVIIDMTHVVEPGPRLSAVDGFRGADAAEVNDLRIVRIDANLTEVRRLALVLRRHHLPGATLVVRPPHAVAGGVVVLRNFDQRVDHIRLRLAYIQRDAAHSPARKSRCGNFLPRLAAISRLIDPTSLAPAVVSPRSALTLVHRGPQVHQVCGIDGELRRAGVFIDIQRLGPGLSTVRRHEHAAL